MAFSGRFNGIGYEVYAPINAVLGIVAKENGEGMWFPKETTDPDPDSPPPDGTSGPDGGESDKKGPPTLKVVK
ncbi:MAG: ClpXP protease specificity-enhancing factor SspB [Gammaproteobacteria bacterium]|nr:ClpXP protease specificity-enhancing factor SspB [Gammaproteobacteria bacterium]